VRAIGRLLRRQRDLRLVLGAGVISMTGDWILHIGLAYYVYDLTGSTLASAAMLLTAFLPSILLSSLAGVFVDRWNRKTTMIIANLVMAVGLLPLLVVQHESQVWIVYLVTAWQGTVELFFTPAEQAMLPRLVSDDDLTTANALNGQVRDIARLVGSAVGGVVVATGGISALALADAATFLIAAALVSAVHTSGRVEEGHDGDGPTVAPSRLAAVFHEWGEGIRVARSERVLRIVFLFILITTTGEGIMGTLFVPFVRDVLHGTGQQYGLIVSVQAIGGIAGGLVAASLGQRVSAVRMFGAGALAFGFVDLVMFLYPLAYVAVWPAVVCMIVVGIPGAVTIAGFTTLLQRHTGDAYRGRVFGALGAVRGVAVVAGTLSAGFLGESVGIVPILSLQGVGYLLAGLTVLAAVAKADDRPGAASSPTPSRV
jgi:Na+/melibiose symporter-like transporter